MNLRSFSVTAGLALAATTLVAVPAPAQAAAISSATNAALRQVNEVGPATCNVANPSSSSSGSFTSNGVASTRSVSGTTTVVDTGDATDNGSVTTAAASKVRATESGGSLRTLDVQAVLSASFSYAQSLGTDCDTQAQVSSQTGFLGVLTAAKWVSIDVEVPQFNQAQVIFQRTSPASPQVFETVVLLGNSKGRAHAELLLPAGTYGVNTTLVATWNSPSTAGDPTSVSAKPFIHVLFEPVGLAKNKASGTATKYLKLKNSRKCGSSQLRGKFTAAAGVAATAKIQKATFKVNGEKSKAVNLPEKNDTVTLTGVPSGEDITVKAILKLFGGGTVTLARDYRSCT